MVYANGISYTSTILANTKLNRYNRKHLAFICIPIPISVELKD